MYPFSEVKMFVLAGRLAVGGVRSELEWPRRSVAMGSIVD
jgi:hypothetical protein